MKNTKLMGRGLLILALFCSIQTGAANYKAFQKLVSTSGKTCQVTENYDLGGKTIKLPKDMMLLFLGGSVKNGVLVYDNNFIDGRYVIECTCSGTLVNKQVTPQMYGARGDGVCDDTQAFAALNGLDVYVPDGTYLISHVEYTEPTVIRGAGTMKTIIKQAANTGQDLLVYKNPRGSILENVCLLGNNNDKTIVGDYQSLLKLYATDGKLTGYGCAFHHIMIKKAPASGFVLLGSGSNDTMITEKTKGLWSFSITDMSIMECKKWGMIDESSDNRFSDFYISACGYGGLLCRGGSNLYCNFKIDGGDMGAEGSETGYENGALLVVRNAMNLQFVNFDLQSAYYCGVKMYSSVNIRFSGDINNCGLGTKEGTAARLKGVKYSRFDASLFNMNFKQKYGFVVESDCKNVDVNTYNRDGALNVNKAGKTCKVVSAQ